MLRVLPALSASAVHGSLALAQIVLKSAVMLWQLLAIAALSLSLACLRRVRRAARVWLVWPTPSALRARRRVVSLLAALESAASLGEWEAAAAALDEAEGAMERKLAGTTLQALLDRLGAAEGGAAERGAGESGAAESGA